ncbi:MAG: DUF6544 family protein [Ferruginibacter sp.]
MITFLFSALGIVMLIILLGKINLHFQFRKRIKSLFVQSNNISNQKFHGSQLNEFPEPMRRYLKLVLTEGQPYISYVRILHEGLFKTGLHKNWINIKGEQYATTEKPGFIWKGTTAFFIAQDSYIGETGQLKVSLLSLFNIVNAKGTQYNEGELLRWLGESVLYPTNFLSSKNVLFFPLDNNSVKLTFNYIGMDLNFIIRFNDIGEIIEMETERFMDEFKKETWVIKLAQYKKINQILVPTFFEVIWRLSAGDFSYAKFNINQIEYNNPTKF